MRKKANIELNESELEKIAIDAMEAIIKKLENENLDASSGVIILERDDEGGITAKVEIEIFTDIPPIPSIEDKAAEVIDEARKVIEGGIYGKKQKGERTS